MASLIIAIVALLIALASAAYTRRQATASEGSLAIDRARRLEERRPRLSGKIARGRLDITLESDEPLALVEITIPPGQGISFQFVYGVSPVRPGEVRLRAFTYDWTGDPTGIKPRESAAWAVNLEEDHSNPVRLEATCRGESKELWEAVLIRAEVEEDPQAWLV